MKSNANNILIGILCFLWILLSLITYFFSMQKGFILSVDNNNNKFYSTQLLSSGGDDFYIFKIVNYFHLIAISICVANIIHASLARKDKYYAFKLSLFVAILDLLVLVLINFDISTFYGIFHGDYLLLGWYFVFAFILLYCISVLILIKHKKYS